MRPDRDAPGPGAPGSTGSTLDNLDLAIDLVRRRLVRRVALRWGALGAWAGALLAALWLGGWLLRWLPLPHFAWLLLPVGLAAGLAAGVAIWRFRAGREDLALLVDKVLGTDEVAVTALGLSGAGPTRPSPLVPVVLAEAESALSGAGVELRQQLRLRWPRHLRWLPLALLAVAAMTFLPRVPIPEKPAGPAGDLEAEADRLEQRKDQLERELGAELPDDVDEALTELIEAMKSGSIGRSDAAEKAEELSDRLDDYAASQGDGAAQALRDAAESLERADPELAEDLKDALDQGDLDAAQEAVERMRERMEQKSPQERERAARELEKAAEQAMKSPMPGLGGALQGEANRLRQQRGGQGNQQGQQGQQGGQQAGGQGNQGSQQGGQQQGGQQQGSQGGQQGQQSGGQQGQGGSQTAGGQGSQQGGESGQEGGGQGGGQGLSEYLDQLDQQGLGGDGLAQDEAQSQLNQEMEQALGGAAGRLGEMEGATGNQGAGDGEGASWGAGRSHTDEDGGNYDTAGVGHQDMNRQIEGRTSDWVAPFDQQHAPERLEGIEAVATTVDVALGEGPVDVETFRLSGSSERSAAGLVQAPAGYREAAEEAIQGEGIPRAYRDQVKEYFDAID
jgi:hypothetical protein